MRPRSVMLIEDNEDDEFLTLRVLRKAGIEEIRIARDGQEALDMLLPQGEPLPEMLLLDLRLPEIHGLTLLAELRRQERTRTLPVIVLSSSNDPKDRAVSLDLGVLAFLIKPLELKDLMQALC